MIGEERIKIYSKRYPLPTKEELNETIKEMGDVTDVSLTAEQFIKMMTETEQEIPNPVKLKEKEHFLKFAKTLAEEYCVDLDIYENSYSYTVDILLPVATYGGRIKRTMDTLTVLSDEVFIRIPNKEDEGDFVVKLSLIYYTHDLYINGKKIN